MTRPRPRGRRPGERGPRRPRGRGRTPRSGRARLSSGRPHQRRAPRRWEPPSVWAGRDGLSGAALATQTRLDSPCPLARRSRAPHGRSRKGMDRAGPARGPPAACSEAAPPAAATRGSSPGGGARPGAGRPAAANAARERGRVQTLRLAFLELQRTLPAVPPDTKLSKLDVLLLATTYIAHLTRSLQDDPGAPAEPGLGALRGDGYLHPVKKWPMRSRLYIGATGQFLKHSVSGEKANHSTAPKDSQP